MSEIRFIHFRRRTGRLDADGLERVDPKGGVTLALLEGSLTAFPLVLHVAAAVCSPEDHFCKARGRAIAGGRLRHGERPNATKDYVMADANATLGELTDIAQRAYRRYHRLDVRAGAQLAPLRMFYGRY